MKNLIAFILLFTCLLPAATGITVLGLPKATTVGDSTFFIVRKASPDSVARRFSFGNIKDTVKVGIHDTLAIRVPQAVDTAATPRFHTVKFAYSATGSTTALLATGNCPATTGTAPNKWLGVIYVNGDTLWIPAWK